MVRFEDKQSNPCRLVVQPTMPSFVLSDRSLDHVKGGLDCAPQDREGDSRQKTVKSRKTIFRKSVRFSPAIITYSYNDKKLDEAVTTPSSASSHIISHQDVDPHSLWYNGEDYSQFKAQALADAKAMIRRNRRCHDDIAATKDTSDCSGSENTTAKIRQAYELISSSDCLMLSLQEMNAPYHGSCEAVGLEKMLGRDVYRDKKQRRERLLDAVGAIQCTCDEHFHGKRHSSEGSSSLLPDHQQLKLLSEIKNVQSILLRRVCETISAPSKVFANYLGESSFPSSRSTSSSTCYEEQQDLDDHIQHQPIENESW